MQSGVGVEAFDAGARLAIINVLNSYGYYLDTIQMEPWFALFAEGAEFEGWQGAKLLSSGADIRERTLARRERHIVTAHRFDTQTPTAASGQSYYQLYSTKDGQTGLVNIGVYEWRMVKQGPDWRFQKLVVRADSGFD